MTNVNKEKKLGVFEAFKLGLTTPRADIEKRYPELKQEKENNNNDYNDNNNNNNNNNDNTTTTTKKKSTNTGILWLGVIIVVISNFIPGGQWLAWLGAFVTIIGIYFVFKTRFQQRRRQQQQ